MRINHNIAALNTYSRLAQATTAQGKSLEKLSSGLRINKAGDDAAGLSISEKMRAQIRGLDQASRNAQDGISLIQTAEGALNETHSMLQRMRELTVQSNNSTNTAADLGAIQSEITQLNSEVDRIAQKTEFNGKQLLTGGLGIGASTGTASYADWQAIGVSIELNGFSSAQVISFSCTVANSWVAITVGGTRQQISLATADTCQAVDNGTTLNFDALGIKMTVTGTANMNSLDNTTLNSSDNPACNFQIGANSSTVLSITVGDMQAAALGKLSLTGGINAVSVTGKTFASNLAGIDAAIATVSDQRSKLGAWQNRLEHTINNLGTSSENLTAAESRVRDVDMAKEMMEFTKNNILNQASTAMLAQANQQPQGVLQLLR